MCNGGASKSKSVEVLRLFTVPSVGASASMAIRTWDNQRQTKNYDRSFVDRGAVPYRLFILKKLGTQSEPRHCCP
jgi:hypothetical protein